MSLVWENYKAGGSEKLTMLALADWCDDNGGSLFPSISGIARKINLSVSQARRIIHSFINAGYLKVVANPQGGNPGQPRHYQLNIKRLSTTCMSASSTDATPSMDAHLPLTPMTPESSVTTNKTYIPEKTKYRKKQETKKTPIPADFSITPELKSWADRKGITNLEDHLEPFAIKCRKQGYKYASWHAAFQDAVTENWAGIGHGKEGGFVPA